MMLLIGILSTGRAWANTSPTPTFPGFMAAFEIALAKNDFPALQKIAGAQPEKLRILFEDVLSDYSLAATESRGKDAENLSALAAAAAVISQELFDDLFLSHQLRLCKGWELNEHLAKVKADIFLRKAKTAFHEGRYGDVVSPGKSALKLYSAINDETGRGTTLHYMGQAQRRLADYPAALSLHNEALKQAVQAGDSFNRGRALIDIGDIYERKKEMETAIEFYTEALQILKSPAHWQEASRALRQLGDVHVATGDFENAYRSYNQALQYAERAKDMWHIAEYNDYIGFCHRSLGDYTMAIKYHQLALGQAEKIVTDIDRLRASARALNHLGICVSKIAEEYAADGDTAEAVKKYREAISHEEKALVAATQVQDRWRQGYLLRALSHMHRELGALLSGEETLQEFNNSLARADEAFALGRQMKEKEWQGLALHSRGLALLLLNRDREGRKAFQQALDLWEKMGDLQSAGYAHQFLARKFYEAKDRLADAETSYDHA
ncbi:MAG: tetratricopeptide repeat protein, partial [Candidatus Aenigmarchaeota archaeon]|nr:tetratricopeptide repeat protein [Candidatus Aenigmarchaeota archaeon]